MSAGDALRPLRGDVVVLRWPEQQDDARRMDALSRPYLLLVEPDAQPPGLQGCTSDWIRLPADDADVRARLTTLAARAERHPTGPSMQGLGELSHHGQRVFLSPLDERIAAALVERFDQAVSESEIFARVWDSDGDRSRIRVHVSRLRKRIAPLGLEITAIRGFGYRLHDTNTLG